MVFFFPSHLCFWQLTKCLQLSVEGILFAQDMWLGCIFSWPHCGDSRLCHEWFPFHWNPKVSLPETWLLSYKPVISCKQCGGVTGLCVQLVDYLSSAPSGWWNERREDAKNDHTGSGIMQDDAWWQNGIWQCWRLTQLFHKTKIFWPQYEGKKVLETPFINQLTDICESLFVEEGERYLKPLFCQCFHAN